MFCHLKKKMLHKSFLYLISFVRDKERLKEMLQNKTFPLWFCHRETEIDSNGSFDPCMIDTALTFELKKDKKKATSVFYSPKKQYTTRANFNLEDGLDFLCLSIWEDSPLETCSLVSILRYLFSVLLKDSWDGEVLILQWGWWRKLEKFGGNLLTLSLMVWWNGWWCRC